MRHWAWLQQLRFDDPVSQATLDSYLLAVQQLEERQRQLDLRLAEFGAQEPYREPVAWLRCFKGIDTVTAVCLVAELHDFRRFRSARELMAYVGLVPSERSSGERQLALVARALAQEADLLLLDEPTAFLDLEHRLAVLELVRERSREGRSALVVSHDLALAARFCDRIAILSEGRVLAAGPPRDVLDPARLREAFGIEAEVWLAPDGAPIVVPHRAAREESDATGGRRVPERRL